MYLKTSYFRSRNHLQNVAALPCQWCGAENQTQAAHSNQLRHGKSKARKAPDQYCAALCYTCHFEIDQGNKLTKEERRDRWNLAWRNTVKLLVNDDLWPVELPMPSDLA
tara:strand:- start:117 stop:443 length:327 start_codon:yes stop_codon:yes gene_type:complete